MIISLIALIILSCLLGVCNCVSHAIMCKKSQLYNTLPPRLCVVLFEMTLALLQLTAICVVLASCVVVVVSDVHQPLVLHHVRSHNLKIVLFLSCDDRRTQFQSIRLAHQLNVWPRSVAICSTGVESGADVPLNLKRLFHHANQRVGIVLDLQCPAHCLRPLLAAASRQWLFHRRYVWLLFAESVDPVFEWLAAENVNVDAEITAASPRGDDDWDLWDVYNPSYQRGGQLNVTHMQRWRSPLEGNATTTAKSAFWQRSKHGQRRQFHGLQLKGVLTVRWMWKETPACSYFKNHI